MRKIILIRHAKSAWDKPDLRDHDRPLAKRGLRDAPEMARRLLVKNILPDLIISSTATRARQTAEITAKTLQISPSLIQLESSIYHAGPETILKQIRTVPKEVQTLFVVGHNPGFNDLIDYLGGNIDNLPTAGQFGFKLKLEDWSEISSKPAESWFYDYPKNSA